ncbi:hypothetical protein P152DRAFT_503338 [Eremomyces bilateralis CBS 781.70]|uniref:Isopenicillin N synthase-like Fe(2+) 2OG dioxygenase domain-containing protein n=1 Tax=Eremomyces bilateralis CBS 781.70 TaxID=1392243 RepID=A0A6G1G4H2_9PEZI|nr:uncharacterized protein P152DRAFT_503338 [Eremomyces bilateralis CBS 781.70]KAF1812810.1 hypothetical protein P152DRAFT_503338 [Eremomyces bilateralis CBS 781.70]
MLHYPTLNERPDKNFPMLYTHTEWGSLTFVWPQSGGIEVETPSNRWMEVPLISGGVVVNVGDAMSFWSGTLKSTLHKINFDHLPPFALLILLGAPLETLQQDAEGTLKSVGKEHNLTMGDYVKARLYMSQLEDAKNNWIGQQQQDKGLLNDLMKAVNMVQYLGIANGTGIINMSQVTASS